MIDYVLQSFFGDHEILVFGDLGKIAHTITSQRYILLPIEKYSPNYNSRINRRRNSRNSRIIGSSYKIISLLLKLSKYSPKRVLLRFGGY